ncbi:MAG: hypothetical protein ABIZ34_03085 [Candidatus Limnocylindrales bacterium]
MTATRIPVVLAIDAEPDDAEIERHTSEPWWGFERCVEIVDRLRPRLAQATGAPVHVTWALRMDEQIELAYGSIAWVTEHYAALLDRLRATGDALGIHPHAWRWNQQRGRWFQDHGDADWVELSIRRANDAFQATLGPCDIHRYGSHYFDRRCADVLRQLGIAHDLSPEPGAQAARSLGPEETTGLIPDQQHAETAIYHPDPVDPFQALPDAPLDDLWVIPHTAFDPARMMAPWRRVARRVRYPGRSPKRPIHLYSGLPSDRFWTAVGEHARSMERPFLSFSLRSDAPLRSYWPAIEAKLDALLQHPLLPELVFATPAETIELTHGG